MRTSVADCLAKEFRVLTACDGRQALDRIEKEPVDIVVTDLNMPEMDGFRLIAHLVASHPQLPVVAMTSLSPRDTQGALDARGVMRVFRKPIDLVRLPGELRA